MNEVRELVTEALGVISKISLLTHDERADKCISILEELEEDFKDGGA